MFFSINWSFGYKIRGETCCYFYLLQLKLNTNTTAVVSLIIYNCRLTEVNIDEISSFYYKCTTIR